MSFVKGGLDWKWSSSFKMYFKKEERYHKYIDIYNFILLKNLNNITLCILLNLRNKLLTIKWILLINKWNE